MTDVRQGAGGSAGQDPTQATQRVTWSPPGDLGAAAALDAATSVAAPLLAGFSVTLAAIVVSAGPGDVAQPGIALLAAVLATVSLVGCVQFGAWARQHHVTPEDYRTWFDDADDKTADARGYYVEELARQTRVYDIHAARARISYSGGIVLLLVALGTVVIPNGEANQEMLRWVACVVAYLAAAAEVAWGVLVHNGGQRGPAWLRRLAAWWAPRA
jgi:hypothetical protein